MNTRPLMRLIQIIASLAFVVHSIGVNGQQHYRFETIASHSSYVLCVKIISRPKEFDWLGVDRAVRVQVVKDYRGNFSKLASHDSIELLYKSASMNKGCLETPLQKGKTYLVFLTGISVFCPGYRYYRITDEAYVSSRKENDHSDFKFCTEIIDQHYFKKTLILENKKVRIKGLFDKEFSRIRPESAWSYGFTRIWGASRGNEVHADGIYWVYWGSTEALGGNIVLYKKGHLKLIRGETQDGIIAKCIKFLRNNECPDGQIDACISEIRSYLTKDSLL